MKTTLSASLLLLCGIMNTLVENHDCRACHTYRSEGREIK